jgi:hypothetical protein
LKKYLFALSALILTSPALWAVEKPGRANVPMVQIMGDSLSFTKFTVSSFTVTTLASASAQRGQITCTNTGLYMVYIGSFSTIAPAGASTYELNLASNVLTGTFRTMSSAALYGVTQAGPATGTPFTSIVYCIAEQ